MKKNKRWQLKVNNFKMMMIFIDLIILICIYYLASIEVAVLSTSGYLYPQTLLSSDLRMS